MNYFIANFNPVAFSLGPLSVTWYGLSYVISFLLCGQYAKLYLKRQNFILLDKTSLEDFMVWMIFGVLLGGRLGYVFFYKPTFYLSYPWEIFYIWEGGMSFHGALIGVTVSLFLFTRKYKKSFWRMSDMLSFCAPIGLFLGRVANFINGELWGHPSTVPWAVIFPGSSLPRHPSQLYEAFTEGALLFFILWFSVFIKRLDIYPGKVTGIFLIGYAFSRFGVEFFREPDAHIGYLWLHLSLGQYLTLPLFILGFYLLLRSVSHDITKN